MELVVSASVHLVERLEFPGSGVVKEDSLFAGFFVDLEEESLDATNTDVVLGVIIRLVGRIHQGNTVVVLFLLGVPHVAGAGVFVEFNGVPSVFEIHERRVFIVPVDSDLVDIPVRGQNCDLGLRRFKILIVETREKPRLIIRKIDVLGAAWFAHSLKPEGAYSSDASHSGHACLRVSLVVHTVGGFKLFDARWFEFLDHPLVAGGGI